MTKANYFFYVIIILLGCLFSSAKPEKQSCFSEERGDLRVMFYNVENLFDTKDDSLKNDNEFLPDSDKHWTKSRYWNKVNKLYKVIAAIGGTEAPEVIGLCEIENKSVLNDLIYQTPLSKYPYAIVHQESPDYRGIDVALLYRKDKINKVSEKFFPVSMPDNPMWKTRDILCFQGQFKEGGELVFFVNHWPSRRGGEKKSEPKRILAAQTLRNCIDSIQLAKPCANIIVMGDFNDTPDNRSLSKELVSVRSHSACDSLINLSKLLVEECNCGSYKYQNAWNMLDQFIISKSILQGGNGFSLKQGANMFDAAFLQVKDEKYGGIKPSRTYLGPRYMGGYSDHLPVFIDVVVEK